MVSRILLSAVVLFFAVTGAAFSEPKQVLLLRSFGRDFGPWNEIARSIREELGRQSPDPIDVFEASLPTARSADGEEGPFADYLRALFLKRQLDLVITTGAPAADFIRQHRQQLFPSVPALYTGLEQWRVPLDALTANNAVVVINNDFPGVI